MNSNNEPQNTTVYQVSEIVLEIRQLLEASYRNIWIEAELSSLSRPASGHWYFSLKDDSAQIRCAMFKGAVTQSFSRTSYTPQEGDLVRVRGKISVYSQRGDMQFIAQHMQPAGEGALRREFELLKEKLAAEGLFNPQLKRALPILPRCIGLITSATGAAIHDILSTLTRRFPSIPVRVYPSVVQGDTAAENLMSAIELAERDAHCDVLVLSRGGGSLEDLWCFNDEQLARKVRACSIPVVSAVGHEVDISICDYAADVRAATPTAAAEIITPDQSEYLRQLNSLNQYIEQLVQKNIQNKAQSVDWLRARLQDPRKKLQTQKQQLDEFKQRIIAAAKNQHKTQSLDIRHLAERLKSKHPQQVLNHAKQALEITQNALIKANKDALNSKHNLLTNIKRHLHTVSPLSTLERGYSITAKDQHLKAVIQEHSDVTAGETVFVKLAKGSLECSVSKTHSKAKV